MELKKEFSGFEGMQVEEVEEEVVVGLIVQLFEDGSVNLVMPDPTPPVDLMKAILMASLNALEEMVEEADDGENPN